MPKATRHKRPIPTISTRTATFELNDYSAGMNTYLGNDKFPVHNDGINYWRLAQDARMNISGEYETRKGFDKIIWPGLTTSSNISATGASTVQFSETVWIAQKFTSGQTAGMSTMTLNLSNPLGTGTGTVLVELWTDGGTAPGTRLSRTSIKSSDIGAASAYLYAYFPDTPSIVSGTNYYIVCCVQPSGNTGYVAGTTTSATTAKISTDSGSTWSSTSYALNYQVFWTQSVRSTAQAPAMGLHVAYRSDGKRSLFYAYNNQLNMLDDSSPSPTVLKSALSSSASNYRFVTVNDVVYYCNGYDGLRKYDLNTAVESQVNTTNYTDLIVHKGLLFGVRADDPTRIEWSNFGLYETFTNTDFQEVPAPKTGDGITALASINGYLLIRTRNHCYIISGSGSADFALDAAPDQHGTYSPQSQVADKTYVYYLSDDGIYRSNGTQADLISAAIYTDIQKLPTKSTACLALNNGRLYVWYTSAGKGYNDRCYVINLHGPGDKEIVESHDTNAFVRRAITDIGDGTLIVASSICGGIAYQEKSTNDYSNMGAELNFELRTHYLTGSSPAVLKSIRYWEPRFGGQDDNYVMTCGYAVDLRDSFQTLDNTDVQGVGSIWGAPAMVWGQFTWGATKETQAQLYVPGEYRRIALRFTHSAARQPQRFLGHTIRFQERRMR